MELYIYVCEIIGKNGEEREREGNWFGASLDEEYILLSRD